MTAGLSLWDEDATRLGALPDRLRATRRHSLGLAAPLTPEDQVVQASDDASPTKWHLAHVTWFFETFLLKPYLPTYRLFDERFPYCFNSYYEAEGARHPRGARGHLTRPRHDEVLALPRPTSTRVSTHCSPTRERCAILKWQSWSRSASTTSSSTRNCC